MRKIYERMGVIPSLFLGVALFVVGLLALSHIVDNWWPFDVGRLDLIRSTALNRADAAALLEAANTEILLAFLGAILVTVTGLVLPLAYILNRRISLAKNRGIEQLSVPRFMVTLRQSMWVGVWIAFCVWLQMNRTFGMAIATLVAFVLILFELLLQVSTRAASVSSR